MVAADETDATKVRKSAAGPLVGNELDRAKKPDGANLADQRVILELRQQRRKRRRAKLLDARDQPLLFNDFEILQRNGTGHRVTGEGVAVIEVVVMGHQRIGDGVVDDDAGKWDVTRRRGLGEGNEVGSDTVVLGSKPCAEAAKAGDYLVSEEQDPVFVDDALDLASRFAERS